MDETGIYAAQQLGQTIARGRRPALLIVDFVEGFTAPTIFAGGLPVVLSRIVHAGDGSDTGFWGEQAPRPAAPTAPRSAADRRPP